jgi:4-diphosphocytidyl-2-C-methyl-D-erythritol kinase
MKGQNDLEQIAVALCPVISDIINRLSLANPVFVRMSGSGATCFALFDDAETLEAARATLDPDWWSLASMLR